MTANLLSQETSPYLLQHKDNPVHWRPWGEEALEEARRANRPVLLSVGYSACHWCHVMAHESFEDTEIARLMNEMFVSIKVDREERPDVDTLYQSALALMGQQGGWPLTMFLTPDGEPFWGGTYFPSVPRYGRPGFPDILRAVHRSYHQEPETIAKNVSALRDALRRLAQPAAGGGLSRSRLDDASTLALRLIDPIRGGTAGAPKFPQPVFFRLLWRAFKRTRSPMFRDAVIVTLDAICQGGIYDHVGGGFARYSTDEQWLVPHFEKMLYDNALLVDLLTEVWRHTRSTLYARRIRETIDWALTDLRVAPDAGGTFAFASAFDADSEGEEGRFYVWTEHEIDALLGEHAARFKAVYDVSRGGNWEGRTILNRSRAPALRGGDVEEELAGCLRSLGAARARRAPPQRDDKVLTDWNGLMITALAHAGAVFEEPIWLGAAASAFEFIVDNLEQDGRLRHSWCRGVARHPAVLDDYANMAQGALALYEATASHAYLERARSFVDVAERFYWDTTDGGYFLSASDTADVISRSKTIADHATPSGNGTMLEVLARLFHLTGESRYRERCDALLHLFSGDNPQYLMSVPGLLTGFELFEDARQVVIVGEPGDPAVDALRRAVFTSDAPLSVVTYVRTGKTLLETHPAHGKERIGGVATAYLCIGQTCGHPVTDAAALRDQLASA